MVPTIGGRRKAFDWQVLGENYNWNEAELSSNGDTGSGSLVR
jgi:hypothetical protein